LAAADLADLALGLCRADIVRAVGSAALARVLTRLHLVLLFSRRLPLLAGVLASGLESGFMWLITVHADLRIRQRED